MEQANATYDGDGESSANTGLSNRANSVELGEAFMQDHIQKRQSISAIV